MIKKTGFPQKTLAPLLTFGLLLLIAFFPITGCGGGSTTGSAAQSDGAQGAVLGGAVPGGDAPIIVTPVVYHHQEELAKVQEAIRKQGAQWIAGETSVSESFENIQDAQVMDGDVEPDSEFPDPVNTGVTANSLAPAILKDAPLDSARAASFSWRTKDGRDWTTAPKDQGHFGTCVAFSSIGAFEIQVRIARNDAALPVALSDWCLWCEGTQKKNPNPGGWDEADAAKRLRDYGTVAESACPYTPEKYLDFTELPGTVKRYKISSYTWVSGESQMKTALESGPLVGSMIVFPSFDNFYTGGIYEDVHTFDPAIDQYRDKTGNPVTAIHHAILIIGYDDEKGCWICKNSSGTGWGEGGYCRIKYGITGGIANGAYKYAVDGSIAFP
jgi:C1A family cysteine protease